MVGRRFPSKGVEFGGDELDELMIGYSWACHLVEGMLNLNTAHTRDIQEKVFDIYYHEERQLAQFIVNVLTKGVLNRASHEFPLEQDIAQEILKELAQPDDPGYQTGNGRATEEARMRARIDLT